MKQIVVVATTDDLDTVNFVAIHRQKEVLHGRCSWSWLDNKCTKVDVKTTCGNYRTDRWYCPIEGFYEEVLNDSDWNGNKREQLQNECISRAIKRAICDATIVQIINI